MTTHGHELTPAKQWLINEMRDARFGAVLHLEVRNGDPVISPPPEITLSIKLGKQGGPKFLKSNLALNRMHKHLFALMERKRNFLIKRVVIHDGLPVHIDV